MFVDINLFFVSIFIFNKKEIPVSLKKTTFQKKLL